MPNLKDQMSLRIKFLEQVVNPHTKRGKGKQLQGMERSMGM